MARVTVRTKPRKHRARVTVHHLMTLFGSMPLKDIYRELRRLNPSKRTLVSLFSTLKTVQASSEVQEEVRRYCRERDCDPSQPPLAKHVHRKPAAGDRRVYSVQYNGEDRPFLRLPLDSLGRPDRVLVSFHGDRVELAPSA